jgi:hypothetical protein
MSICDNIKDGEKNMEKVVIYGAVSSAIIATATFKIAAGL